MKRKSGPLQVNRFRIFCAVAVEKKAGRKRDNKAIFVTRGDKKAIFVIRS